MPKTGGFESAQADFAARRPPRREFIRRRLGSPRFFMEPPLPQGHSMFHLNPVTSRGHGVGATGARPRSPALARADLPPIYEYGNTLIAVRGAMLH